MRKKPIAALLSNVRVLPGQVCEYRRKGRTADADRAEKILRDTRAELERRGRAP